MDILEKHIISVISQVSEIAEASISCSSTFEELKLSSLDAVTIAYELEEEFGVRIPDDKVYTISTVQELIDGIRHLTKTESIDE